MSVHSDELATQERPEEEPTADLQFLAWDVEGEVWRLMTVADLLKSVEDAHYSGCGHVTSIMALEPSGAPRPKVASLVAGETKTDDDDWMHTRYEIRGNAGEVFGAFTTRIDGRS